MSAQQDHGRRTSPGTVIEQNGDGCLEDSKMPVGWPLHLDGAVKQRYLHRTTTLSELNDLLQVSTRSEILSSSTTRLPNGRGSLFRSNGRFFPSNARFFLARARCLSAGLRYLRLTRLPRHDRGPVPGGNRSAASCLCTVLRRALYHYATRLPFFRPTPDGPRQVV